MRYILQRAFMWLAWHKKVYITLIVELIVGVCLFIVGVNSVMTANEELAKAKESIQKDVIDIFPRAKNWDIQEMFPITYNDYIEITEEFDEILEFQYYSFAYTTIYDISNGQDLKELQTTPDRIDNKNIRILDIIFMNDLLYEKLFGTKRKEGGVYASDEAIETIEYFSKLEDGQYKMNSKKLDIDNNQLIINDIGYTLTPIENLNKVETMSLQQNCNPRPYDVPLSQCIIFPLEVMTTFNEDDIDSPTHVHFLTIDGVLKETTYYPEGQYSKGGGSLLSFRYKNVDFEKELTPTIIDKLNNNHKGVYHFETDNSVMRAEESISFAMKDMKQLLFASCFMLAVVVLGIIGIIMIFLNRRKKSIAISLAVGATFKTTALELITEIFIVNILGCGLGVLVSYFAMPFVSNFIFNYTFHMKESITIGLIIAIVITLLASFLALLNIRNFKPAKILREI